jgi:hypothetical protein
MTRNFIISSIVRRTKLMMLQWDQHVGKVGRQEIHTEFWCGDVFENVHLEEDRIYEMEE